MQVLLYNLSGELVKTASAPGFSGKVQMPLDGLAAGIYMVVLEQRLANAILNRSQAKLALIK